MPRGCAPPTRRRIGTRWARARSPAPDFPSTASRRASCWASTGPTGNTYGSIATVDYLLESVSATSVAVTGLGRFVQDLLLWGTREFGYLRLRRWLRAVRAASCRRSATRWRIEHARAIGSKALGQAQAHHQRPSTTRPFGDIVDTEDDLQPLVSSMFRDAVRAFGLVAAGDSDGRSSIR